MHELPGTPHAFNELLIVLDKRLQPEILATLRPPASEASVAQIEQILDAPLLLPLRQLLHWHDGQEWNAKLRETDNRRLLSASEIINIMEFFLGPDEEFCEPWGRYWVPFLTNDSGDYVVVDASPLSNGELILYWHDWDDRSVLHKSLSDWATGLKDELSSSDV